MMEVENSFFLRACLVELMDKRYTLGGVPTIKFVVHYQGLAFEQGVEQKVQLTMPCIAFGLLTDVVASTKLGEELHLKGFLVSKMKQRSVLFRVQSCERNVNCPIVDHLKDPIEMVKEMY
ncbi:MAG: hypothetical protein QM520_05860 [Gammaproteobacteria bacterium]|nr:hypothetical protein [Gammaproteobacteria bacterium]